MFHTIFEEAKIQEENLKKHKEEYYKKITAIGTIPPFNQKEWEDFPDILIAIKNLKKEIEFCAAHFHHFTLSENELFSDLNKMLTQTLNVIQLIKSIPKEVVSNEQPLAFETVNKITDSLQEIQATANKLEDSRHDQRINEKRGFRAVNSFVSVVTAVVVGIMTWSPFLGLFAGLGSFLFLSLFSPEHHHDRTLKKTSLALSTECANAGLCSKAGFFSQVIKPPTEEIVKQEQQPLYPPLAPVMN